MDIVAWVLQVLLCLMFLIHAVRMLRPNWEQLLTRGMSYIADLGEHPHSPLPVSRSSASA